jgi:hypothetical protein
VAGDTFLAIGLADSVFFALPVGQAKIRVLLYLLLTMAPLAVAAPLLSKLLDRGGFRRAIAFTGGVVRCLAAALLATRTESWLLFPLAFAALVGSRVHLVTKNALTAAYADRAGLVRENALLSRVAAFSAVVATIPAVTAAKLGGPGAAVFGAAAAYAGCAWLTTRLPVPREAPRPQVGETRPVPHEIDVLGWGMAAFRAGGGFLVILVAFELRRAAEPGYWLGILLGGLAAGTLVGAAIAPRLAASGHERRTLLGALAVGAASAGIAGAGFTLPGLVAFAFAFGAAMETGRLAFQSALQEAAGHGAEGRAFVRNEVRFQLGWVAGALVPALAPVGFRLGLLMIAALVAVVGAWLALRRPAPG